MKAIIVNPPNPGVEVKDIELSQEIKPGQVKIRTIYTGICGTDRGIVSGKLTFSRPPENASELILGHEAMGIVEEVGEGVERIKKGDLVVPVVRRGCGICLNCKIGRPDFCETGKFVEAGIRGLNGFMREEFIDDEVYLVRVPESIRDIGMLTEPLSNVVKAVDGLLNIQKRMIWTCEDSTYECRNAFVVGSGPIGTFFSLLLRTNGFNVYILNRRDPSPTEEYIAEKMEAKFYNTSKGLDELPPTDVIVDTSGYPSAFLPLLKKFKKNAALVLFGTSSGDKVEIDADLITFFVENNIELVGSVNASKKHFREAVSYLTLWKEKYGSLVPRMITSMVSPEKGPEVVSKKIPGEIKTVIKWS